ncbi:UNVERIFIED_CONTAM: hypothetical protein NCL1_22258 [Trichonephila clavipes]
MDNSLRPIEIWAFHPRSATCNPFVQFSGNILDNPLFDPLLSSMKSSILERSPFICSIDHSRTGKIYEINRY